MSTREDREQEAREIEAEAAAAGVPPLVYLSRRSDDDLPGTWSYSDIEGGDPDERSYTERGWAPTGKFPQPSICPECMAGKHPNCDGTAWDVVADTETQCQCTDAWHTD
jgi:hypothetical protein